MKYDKHDRTSLRVLIAELVQFDDRFGGHDIADLAKLTLNLVSRVRKTKLPETMVRDDLLRAQRGLGQLSEMVDLMIDATNHVEPTEWTGMKHSEMVADMLEQDKARRATKH